MNYYYLLIPAFWIAVIIHNLYRNRSPRQGGDTFGRQWHAAQFCEWVVVYVTFICFLQWQIVTPLFVLCGCLFNGYQNIFWAGQDRGWFYVFNREHPEVTKDATDRFFMRFGKNAELVMALTQVGLVLVSLIPAAFKYL